MGKGADSHLPREREMQDTDSRLSRQQRRALEREQGKRSQGTRKGVAVASGALTLGVALAGQPAQAATFNVTNLGDSGPGSLRQAIEDANGAAGADTVTFQAGLTGTITLTTGQLAITDSVDIQGPGAAAISVSGDNASRVFYLYNGSAEIAVTISGLTVTGGRANIGGGIVNFDEDLVLDGLVITGNTASADGGGLWADGIFDMSLTIRNSTISGNTAGSDGGGIYIEDAAEPVLIQNTVITGNDAADDGGGIYFYDPDNSTTIEGSTISGNTAGDLGGGIYMYDTDGGTHLITGTTISGNTANNGGGGIFLYGPDDPFVIENSTISGNQAVGSIPVGNGYGGGIFLYSLYADFAIRHSTIVGNSATGTGGGVFTLTGPIPIEHSIVADNNAGVQEPDLGTEVDGSFDVSFSLIETPSTANIADNGGNVFGQDPQLGPLANNGGPTQTHLPAGTSPAVNAGDPAFAPPPATDQRGFDRVAGGRIDIGAVEVNPGTIQLTVAAASVAENAGTVTITATRTGGTDGAVSVTFATSNGTAVAPGDYTAAGGTLNWASGDGTAKSFQVTILNDLLDEPDETFSATISAPTGGAALGGITTQVVTITDDDAPVTISEIPTLGDVGKILLAALFGAGGLLLMRRRKKDLVAPVLAVTLAAGAAQAAPVEKAGKDVDVRAATLAQIEPRGNAVVIRLADGTTYEVAADQLKVVDRRKGLPAGVAGTPSPNQPVVLKVRRGKDGKVQKVKLELVRTAEQARAAAAKDGE
jgi:parallel beta-helix repeat protein